MKSPYYLPWNPLQLSTAIDSGLRVKKNTVLFALYRSKMRKFTWSPLVQNNIVNFYGEVAEVETLVEHLANQSKKLSRESFILEFFDIGSTEWDILRAVDNRCSVFNYHPYEESPKHFVTEMSKHVQHISAVSRKEGFIEAPNKRLQIVLAHFSEDQWDKLVDDSEALIALEKLLTAAPQVRVYLWLLTPSGAAMPEFLVETCSYGFFLGDENTRIAEEFHFPEVKTAVHALTQKFIGVTWEVGKEELGAVHPLTYTKSTYSKAYDKRIQQEAELYREFLNSLDDGTSQ